MAGAPKRASLPRINTSVLWPQIITSESVERRLLGAVADILGLQRHDIELFDSFADLGGDHRTAMALRKVCLDLGMAVATKDILGCQTLAELQTCITPCARPPTQLLSVESLMVAPLNVGSPGRLAPAADGEHSRRSSRSTTTALSEARNEVEEFLDSVKAVQHSAIIKPRAGLLDGKLVAFLVVASVQQQQQEQTGAGAASEADVQLIPQSQMFFAGTQVASIRQAVEASGILHDVPAVWIVLAAMPLLAESHEIDRRKLRTWAQNINEETFQQVLSLDTHEALQAPATEMERSLQRLVAKVLPIPQDQVGMNFAFSQLGGDELAAMQLVARSKVESIYLKVDEVLQTYTLGQLAASASQRGGLAHRWSESFAGFDLSPMQQLYFRTEMGGDDARRRGRRDGRYRFNQSLLLKIKRAFTVDDVCAAVEAVVGHHSMLRARFARSPAGWTQRILPEIEGSYALNHHTISSNKELVSAIDRSQLSIDVENGPVFAVDYFQTSDGHQMLYVVAHHLVVDLLSWRVIIQDLDELLENGSLLSQRSMPFQKWVEFQKKDAQLLDARARSSLSAVPGDYQYWGMQAAPNTYGDAVEVGFALSEELTALLQTTCNQVFRTDSADVYLAALLLSFALTFTDRPPPTVWNQEHGRQPGGSDIDISETVGWFTTMCPVSQRVEPADDFVDVLRRLKDSRRSGPARSSQYLASKFFNADATDIFTHDWPFELIFSYAGSLQQLERGNGLLEQLVIPGRTIASNASDMGSGVGRIALFEVSAMVDRGTATVKILYNRYSLHQDRITAWIQSYEHLLLEAIGRLRYHPQELTLADLPHLDVGYDGLAKLNKERSAALRLGSVRDIEAVYPVTATQQSILISQARSPAACHLHTIYDFASPNGQPVDAARICSAWQNVVAKHTALRTVFIDSVTESGLYDQVVLRRCSPNMLFIDPSPNHDAVDLLTNLPLVPASSSGRPHHRLAVLQTATRALVKLDISEALCDPLSVHALLADLRRAYATEKPLPEPTGLSYPAYINFLQSARSAQSLDFWRQRLGDVQPCLFPGLAVAEQESGRYERAHVELEISAGQVADFGRANKASTKAVLRLAWALVLRSFVGTNTVCFGFRTSGREAASNGPSMRGAVGCFANMVMCNLDLSAYKSLAMVLQTAEDQYTSCLPHQHIAVAEIHHALGMRGNDRLFNSVLSFSTDASDLNSKFTTREGFEIRSVRSQETSQHELAVNVRCSEGKLLVSIGSTIMLEAQATGLAHTFGRAIKAVLDAPHGSVGGVDLFTDRDYAQIISWGNEADAGHHPHQVGLLHGLVANMAAAQPVEAQAVCAWNGELTYSQLQQYASMLAQRLVQAGVGPHVTVPVVLEKSVWAPVMLLAVLMAGGAFVPIDAEELSLLQPISAQLNAKVAVSCESAASAVGTLFETVVVVSSALLEQLTSDPHQQHPEPTLVTEDDIACVFFTPVTSKDIKGLAFTHAAMSTALSAQGPAASITSASRVLQLSSFHVDIALAEVFTTLISGGCVCIPTSSDRIVDYAGAVRRMDVNWSYMTPLLSRKVNVDLVPSLKTVCFRTRCLDEDSWMLWADKKKVLFAYGAPDICALGISFLEVSSPRQLNRFGRPLVGSFWVVNPEDHRRLMPVGAVGELVIEGPTLGCDFVGGRAETAHWNRADFNDGKKTKYFKTGHRVRYTEGGCMEIVSSKREDLEIGGKTIVLADIEQHVRRCLGHGIDVMVEAIAFKGSKSVPILAAFVELGALFEGSDDLTKLSPVTKERLFMAKKLVETGLRNSMPAYKLPSIYIPIRHLPVTPSLKVNRRKLQKKIHGLSHEQLLGLAMVPNPHEVQTIGLKPLPLTETEERMRQIWADVLTVDTSAIGAADGFFQCGGDNVLAASLVTTCRRQGITISITDVLRNASLADLCRCMSAVDYSAKSAKSGSNPALSPPQNTGEQNAASSLAMISETLIDRVLAPKAGVERKLIREVVEATAMQTRYIESGMLRGRANINYFVFKFTGPVDSRALEAACEMLAAIHPILRTAFVPHSRRVYQVVLKSHGIDFKRYLCPSFRLASLAEKMIKKDQSRPVAFSAPMTRFMYLDGGKQSTLVMRLSRAQYDGVSIALLVKDLKTLYGGSQNPPRRPSYGEFVRCSQLANAHGAEDYWKSLLDGAGGMTQVVVHDKPYQLTASPRTVRQRLAISSLANFGIPFDTVLKAAWGMTLATLSGSSDVVFGEVIEGRHMRLGSDSHPVSVSGVLGPTTNEVPVRVRFPDVPLSPLGLLHAVHAQRGASIPFENLGFLDIVAKCTSWPYWTRPSTLVQHLYEETVVSAEDPKMFHLGGATCNFTVQEARSQDVPDMLVRSMLRGSSGGGGDKVELSITFCEHRVPVSFAEDTLRLLVANVSLLTSVSIMQPVVPGAGHYRTLQRQIPLPQAPGYPGTQLAEGGAASAATHHLLSAADAAALHALISAAWASVLDPAALGVPEELRQTAAFFDLWGSLIPAAQLAGFLTKELPRAGLEATGGAISVSMEEIIEYPTMSKQFELLARKITRRLTAATPLSPSALCSATTPTRRSLGQSIRRLASSGARAVPPSPMSSSTLTPRTAIHPSDVSPLTPVVTPPSSHPAPPQPQALSPLAEEPAGADGMESLTEGSSAADDDFAPFSPTAISIVMPHGGVISPVSPEPHKQRGGMRGKGSAFFGGLRISAG